MKKRNKTNPYFVIALTIVLLIILILIWRFVYFEYINEPRWHSSNLTYSFLNGKDCDEWQSYRIRRAFQEVQYEINETLRFREVNGTADIIVNCHNEKRFNQLNNCLAVGEANYDILGNNILSAEISIYNYYLDNQNCLSSVTEKHEILHALGIEHINNPDSIMYPYLHYYEGGCLEDRNIDEEIVRKIKEIYG